MKIESEYTLEECKKDMLMMWKWLAETGSSKLEFQESKDSEGYRGEDCACCKYDSIRRIPGIFDDDTPQEIFDDSDCTHCPIVWSHYNNNCQIGGTMFEKWDFIDHRQITSPNYRTRSKKMYAKEIYKLALRIKI